MMAPAKNLFSALYAAFVQTLKTLLDKKM